MSDKDLIKLLAEDLRWLLQEVAKPEPRNLHNTTGYFQAECNLKAADNLIKNQVYERAS